MPCMSCGAELTSAGCPNCERLSNTDTTRDDIVSSWQPAHVILRQGRFFLVVNGLFLAMQGDPCRDPSFGQLWEYESLVRAAATINNAR